MAPPTLAPPPPPPNANALLEALERSLESFTPPLVRLPQPVVSYQHDFTAEIELAVATLDAALTREVWLPRVNLATLDVYGEDTCVVGQVASPTFYEGVELLGGPSLNLKDSDEKVNEQVERLYAWTDARGFTVNEELCEEHGEKFMFRQLTDQWVRKIAQLRAEVMS